MSRPNNIPLITDDRALGGSTIERSLRFNSGDTAYLTRTNGSGGNRTTFTWSGWIKRTKRTTDYIAIFTGQNSVGANSNDGIFLQANRIHISWDYDDSGQNVRGTRTLEDHNGWYHIVWAVDTTLSTASDRMKLYVNGSQYTLDSTVAQNENSGVNKNTDHNLGIWRNGASTNYKFDGYMAEVHFVDGQQHTPSDFGYTESQTGIWRPKKYEGTHGTTGFYLNFNDNSAATAATIGKDRSGNANDWTPNNFSVSAGSGNDSMLDTPTNNFATMNPLVPSPSVTWANGNLDISGSNATEYSQTNTSTFGVSSGKWYVEVKYASAGSNTNPYVGICPIKTSATANMTGTVTDGAVLRMSNETYVEGTETGSVFASGISVGNTIGIALDMDNLKVWFSVQGTYANSGNPATGANAIFSGITAGETMAICIRSLNASFNFNFGQRPFSYTPPTGFKALSSNNLPPTVPSIIAKKHFDTVLYTGNGSTGQSITSLEFQPDLVWCKSRSNGRNHVMTDSVRGRAKGMYPDATNTDFTDAAGRGLVSFNSNGFTVGNPENASSHNNSGETIVAWCWKAGGNSNTFNVDGTGYATAAAAGLDGGSLDPTGASINTEAGFSIITYTGTNNTSETISHGLGKKPAWILVKSRSVAGQDWVIYHKKLDGGNQPATHIIKLNTSDAEADVNDVWNDTEPTSSVFTVGTEAMVNHTAGDTYLAYCWSEIPGYSKFGLYTGNGTSDGPFVYTGFTPRFIIYRKSPSENWHMFDTKRSPNNTTATVIDPNRSAAETTDTNTQIDILSNGFKLRSSHGTSNASSTDYIYMAWAEHTGATPYQTEPNAR